MKNLIRYEKNLQFCLLEPLLPPCHRPFAPTNRENTSPCAIDQALQPTVKLPHSSPPSHTHTPSPSSKSLPQVSSPSPSSKSLLQVPFPYPFSLGPQNLSMGQQKPRYGAPGIPCKVLCALKNWGNTKTKY